MSILVPTEASQPQPALVIFFDGRSISVAGPATGNPVLAYGLMELAKDALRDEQRKTAEQRRVVAPTPAETTIIGSSS